ncbi:hypothetical protein [Streptomyces olindensis]|uniref:hypothetical protein n=1 Tax=Streptomyces olindensis TaxID=358823 RepID=UPI0033DF24F0
MSLQADEVASPLGGRGCVAQTGQARKTARTPAAKDTKKTTAKKTTAKRAPSKTARAASGSRRGSGKGELRQPSKAELYERATAQDLPGRSKMSREELVEALARAGRHRKTNAACPPVSPVRP